MQISAIYPPRMRPTGPRKTHPRPNHLFVIRTLVPGTLWFPAVSSVHEVGKKAVHLPKLRKQAPERRRPLRRMAHRRAIRRFGSPFGDAAAPGSPFAHTPSPHHKNASPKISGVKPHLKHPRRRRAIRRKHLEFDFRAHHRRGQTMHAFAQIVARLLDHDLAVHAHAVGLRRLRLGRSWRRQTSVMIAHREDEFLLEIRVEGQVDLADRRRCGQLERERGGQRRRLPTMRRVG